ncbi:stage II sporulation protein R [Tissierella sp. Yu-01]|uniref:stage II sporulation protein R n=1 Tax=Tissierella sp. Yu-01 TaxID=3035694 RepID=UPI00240D0F8F|nr:stage II sporulation protein R [Tissierella sp. Yu-01]WFA08517.1 stage II sporulation protein R [Tissierella sp. Yu-01]
MKYKKAILILSIFLISFIYIIHPIIEDKLLLDNPFKEGIIRFHVRANSDKAEDQELKLKVRDEILEVMVAKFEDSSSIDESREIIKENMNEIKVIAERVVKKYNYDYPVEISLGMDYFPTRKYGNMVFPQGEYETLLVTIGKGEGQNWWCVMFPPLCFVDITHSVAYDPENQFEEYVMDETQPLKLKSKTVEFVEKLLD